MPLVDRAGVLILSLPHIFLLSSCIVVLYCSMLSIVTYLCATGGSCWCNNIIFFHVVHCYPKCYPYCYPALLYCIVLCCPLLPTCVPLVDPAGVVPSLLHRSPGITAKSSSLECTQVSSPSDLSHLEWFLSNDKNKTNKKSFHTLHSVIAQTGRNISYPTYNICEYIHVYQKLRMNSYLHISLHGCISLYGQVDYLNTTHFCIENGTNTQIFH